MQLTVHEVTNGVQTRRSFAHASVDIQLNWLFSLLTDVSLCCVGRCSGKPTIRVPDTFIADTPTTTSMTVTLPDHALNSQNMWSRNKINSVLATIYFISALHVRTALWPTRLLWPAYTMTNVASWQNSEPTHLTIIYCLIKQTSRHS